MHSVINYFNILNICEYVYLINIKRKVLCYNSMVIAVTEIDHQNNLNRVIEDILRISNLHSKNTRRSYLIFIKV